MKKKIYDFHYKLVDKHIKELKETGKTIIRSYFLLEIFKQKINENYKITKDIDFKGKRLEFSWSGTSGHHRCLYKNKALILKFLRNGKMRKQDFEAVLKSRGHFYQNIQFSDIDILFNRKSSREELTNVLNKITTFLKSRLFVLYQYINMYGLYKIQ